MKKFGRTKKVILLAIVLAVICMIWILLNGRTYVAKIDFFNEANSLEELNIINENQDIVEITSQAWQDNALSLTLQSRAKGRATITIKKKDGEMIHLFHAYVHSFGVISYNSYLGDCTGCIIIPLASLIWFSYTFYFLLQKYREEKAKNKYQYKNIVYLGLILFVGFAIVNQLFTIWHYRGLVDTIQIVMGLCTIFSLVLLPIAFITFVLVTISNLVLIKKEGFSLHNLLGVFLGVFVCFATVFPEILNRYLFYATWIDVHKENGFARYLQEFVELFVYAGVSYLECILIATIILAIKAAKSIPAFDKDFIIILGCQIKKDGTLTNLLKGRVDRAIDFQKMQKEKTNKDLVFVPSGGKGSDEIISEAEAMKNYLVKEGIPEEKIMIENQSKNTWENIQFSNRIITEKNKQAKIAYSTTNYHVFRAGSIAYEQGLNMDGIGSKTKSYFWINAFIREFIATIVSEKKKHIFILGIIILIAVCMVGLLYLSNII